MRRRRRVAFVGLGHMGSHMCRHVCTHGHRVTAFDLDRKAVARATRTGARPAPSVAECVADAAGEMSAIRLYEDLSHLHLRAQPSGQ